MAEHSHILPEHRAVLAPLLAFTLLLAGCDSGERKELAQQAEQTKGRLEETERKLAEAEKALAANGDVLAMTADARDTAKARLAEVDAALSERTAQLESVIAELDGLKKHEALVFAGIRAEQRKGRHIIALADYEKFLKAYPEGDFAELAMKAVAEIQAQKQRDNERWAAMTDPKRKEREFATLFRDGLLTPRELAPWIKKKTRAQVIALLGRPSHLFPGGSEIGYNDKIVNPATGRRTMLVIAFDADVVSTLRAEYAGQRLIP